MLSSKMFCPDLISVGYASMKSLGVHYVDVTSHALSVTVFNASCDMILGVAIGILFTFGVVATSCVSTSGFSLGEQRLVVLVWQLVMLPLVCCSCCYGDGS